tara:strand:- start:188 stop:1039 length:852 start_codon:yes stop_codon:yes gene_type:complete
MSGLIENEMTNCLQQMAELQAKMEVLQQEKNKKAAEEVVKKQEVEPNLKVMSDWLQEYGESIDEVERERIIVEQYNSLEDFRGSSNSPEYKISRYEFLKNLPPVDSEEERREQKKEMRRFGIMGNTDISQLLIKYEPTKEEYELYNNREAIKAKYFSLKQSRKQHQGQDLMCCPTSASAGYTVTVTKRTNLLNNSKNFIPGNHHPSYFMKQYIESTHNMFLIQQKRINELEERLEKLKPELSNEDFGFDDEESRRAYVQPRTQGVDRAREDESTRKINLALDN